MQDIPNTYGLLINKNILLHRKWFIEMAKLNGIGFIYRAPKNNSTFDSHGELNIQYEAPELVYGIFQDHPDQKTIKKMGWVAELQEGSSIIHVPYDLHGLQVGALFTLPSGIDEAIGRTFRVISMQNIMMYPASIACEVALEYEDTTKVNTTYDFKQDTFTKLLDNPEDD